MIETKPEEVDYLLPQDSFIKDKEKPFSVSTLNKIAGKILEENFSLVYVVGEISGFINHRSGHWYFTLKDEESQLKACCFKGMQKSTSFLPKNGQQVIVRGKLTIYKAQGSYQLVADQILEAGQGLLQKKFEELKEKLNQEGLFSPLRKKKIPAYVRRIGVVTSSEGAAIRDFIKIATSYDPHIQIVIFPARVQGTGSAEETSKMIDLASSDAERLGLQALVITRGGGSIEDLWTFNEEIVVRAISRCKIPTISAIGHEVDFTLSDFAADLRCATPSAAAQMIAIDVEKITRHFNQTLNQLNRLMRYQISLKQDKLRLQQVVLRDPSRQLGQYRQLLDQKMSFAEDLIKQQVAKIKKTIHAHEILLEKLHPKVRFIHYKTKINNQFNQLIAFENTLVRLKKDRLVLNMQQLHALSPLNVLERGYSVAMNPKTHVAVKNFNDVECGDTLQILIHQGQLNVLVQEKLRRSV